MDETCCPRTVRWSSYIEQRIAEVPVTSIAQGTGVGSR
jgi:hypothetical protein